MEVKNISLYYEYIINLIVELYREELELAKPGHCMKITGMGNDEMMMLWEALSAEFDNLDTFIINETFVFSSNDFNLIENLKINSEFSTSYNFSIFSKIFHPPLV